MLSMVIDYLGCCSETVGRLSIYSDGLAGHILRGTDSL
jgi:hypothetical protein